MKTQILTQILELTKMQSHALQEEDIDKWTQLMQDRQTAMDALDQLHNQHPEYKLQKEETLLKEIIALDEQNKKEFHRQFEEVKNNLRKIRSQQKAGNVYSNPYDISQEEGIFFDKR